MSSTRLASVTILTLAVIAGSGGPVFSSAEEKRNERPVTVTTVAEVDAGTGGIEVDRAGNVYTSDFGAVLGQPETAGTRIWKVTPDGESSVFGEGLEGASGSAMDSKGNFYQANIRGNVITKIAPSGEQSRFASDGLVNPVGIVIDDDDTLFVANCGSSSILRIDEHGATASFVQSRLLSCPNGITMDDERNLYVANFMNGDVVRITPEAEVSVLATLPGGNNGHLVYARGGLFVVDRGGHRIYRVELDGSFEVHAGSGDKGGEDGAALEAGFCYPNDIAVGPDGSLYVNDVGDESSVGRKLGPTRIRRIGRAGK